MKSFLQFIALALVGAVFSGCHTTEGHFARIVNEPRPVPTQVRESFGVMGVLPATTAAKFNFKHPADIGEATEEISARSFDALSDSIMSDEDASFGEQMGLLGYSAVLSGVAGVVGGIFTGVPEGDLKRAQKEVQQALLDNPFEPGVGAQLKEIVAVTHCKDMVEIPEAVVAGLTDADLASGNFRALAGSGINSVLILRVAHEGFSTSGELNPVMAVDIRMDIQVVRVSDGQKLFGDLLRYRGERRQFTRWGANKAKLFRAELETAQATFAAAVYDELAGDGTIAPPK